METTDFEIFQKNFTLVDGVYILNDEHDTMPDIVRGRIRCFECGECFRDCAYPDDCAEIPLVPSNPDRFKDSPEGFLETDSEGRGLYIPLCGKNDYS